MFVSQKSVEIIVEVTLLIDLTDLYSLMVLNSRPRRSLILRGLLLHGHLVLLLCLLGLDKYLVSLAHLRLEILVDGQQLLEVDS